MSGICKVDYNKVPLTVEQQADLLLSRGLIAERTKLVSVLKNVSYYRLSGYLYPFKRKDVQGAESLIEGTTLDQICAIYGFDRQFRLLIFDAIERVEIALRAKIVNLFTQEYGAFGYLNLENFDSFEQSKFQETSKTSSKKVKEKLYLRQASSHDFDHLMEKLKEEINRHKHEAFIKHYDSKYTNSESLPFWIASEVMSFGELVTIFRHLKRPLRKAIACDFELPEKVMSSWLKSLQYIRNVCAHHSRLWDQWLSTKPTLPDTKASHLWHGIKNDRVFAILLMLRHLLNICAPNTRWRERVETLLGEHPNVPLERMDMDCAWRKHPLWRIKPTTAR